MEKKSPKKPKKKSAETLMLWFIKFNIHLKNIREKFNRKSLANIP